MEKLRKLVSRPPAAGERYRVVAHRPAQRAALACGVIAVVLAAAGLGYWLGVSKRALDVTYLEALETRERALETRVEALNRELADARLTQSVDSQAAQSLRQTIAEMRDRLAGLREEVTFYKSLMAPSSLERGLQIAELDLGSGEADNEYTYHLLLTQAEERRSWVQGRVEVEVRGVRGGGEGSGAEEALPLTAISEVENYPLRFRFRYFQDFSGVVTLPEGFRPQAVVVVATPSGGGAERAERRFDWIVQPP
jgi:hypothetical protein